jgi:hypothetical protein
MSKSSFAALGWRHSLADEGIAVGRSSVSITVRHDVESVHAISVRTTYDIYIDKLWGPGDRGHAVRVVISWFMRAQMKITRSHEVRGPC